MQILRETGYSCPKSWRLIFESPWANGLFSDFVREGGMTTCSYAIAYICAMLKLPIKRYLSPLTLFAAILYVCGSLFIAVIRPQANGDLPFYVASYYAATGNDEVQTYAKTYAALRAETDSLSYHGLRYGNSYLASLDAVGLDQQLPFYQIKPLYLGAIQAVASLGLSPIRAIRVVSLVFALSLTLILFGFCLKQLGSIYGSLAAVFIFQLVGIDSLASIATPDAMAATLFVGGLLLFLRGNLLTSVLTLIAALLCRGDMILILLPLPFILMLRFKEYKREIAALGITIATGIGLQLFIQNAVGYYGWKIHFYHSFLEYLTYPATAQVGFTLPQYIYYLLSGLWIAPGDNTVAAVGLIWLLLAGLGLRLPKMLTNLEKSLIAGLLAGTLIRYLSYPSPQLRLYVPQYIILFLLAMTVWSRYRSRSFDEDPIAIHKEQLI